MPERRPRIISPGGFCGPTGGTRYNQRVAAEWGVDVEYLPGRWPEPDPRDLEVLAALLHRPSDDAPILLDGLIGSAAGPVLTRRNHARGSRAAVAVHVHLPLPAETGLSARRQDELRAAEQMALRAADAVACTSTWAAADLQRRYGLADAVVAEPGADVRPVAPGSHPPCLLTLASFSPRKNHHLLVEAMQDPGLRRLEWSALWMGAEPAPGAQDRLARATSEASCAGRITVAGAVTGAALERVWAGTDLLLLPSLAETYGMVVTEALAHGIPAIVGADTGAEDTLRAAATAAGAEHAPPGDALNPRDPGAWAQALHAWLTDSEVRGRWRQAALACRARLPDWAQTARRLHELLEEAGPR
ncbi:MAG: glycosyltransferase family 4 protein [Ornithinimicrobium sp.]